jgi:5-formyltetrahydrofolate cyclo-ligase
MTSAGPEGLPRASRSKADLRARLRAGRAVRVPDPSAEEARTVRALTACAGAGVVAAYAAVPGEPATAELIEQLHLAGVRVLLPVLRREPGWAWYTGPARLVPGPLGIPAPTGPPLGPEALGAADWVWLPGLAGTPDGRRLGTGGGWYDRALAWAAPDAPRGLLLFDDEVLDDLPTDEWDRPVDVLVTERRRLDVRAE